MTNDSAVLEALKADAQSADTSPDWPGQSWHAPAGSRCPGVERAKGLWRCRLVGAGCLPVTNNWPGHV